MEELKIKLKVEQMIVYGYTALKQFPKSERHVLAAEIRHSMHAVLRHVIRANRRYFKKTTAQDLDAELDMLRSFIRVAYELQYLPLRKYETWSRHLAEIGAMIGGWLAWMKRSQSTNGAER